MLGCAAHIQEAWLLTKCIFSVIQDSTYGFFALISFEFWHGMKFFEMANYPSRSRHRRRSCSSESDYYDGRARESRGHQRGYLTTRSYRCPCEEDGDYAKFKVGPKQICNRTHWGTTPHCKSGFASLSPLSSIPRFFSLSSPLSSPCVFSYLARNLLPFEGCCIPVAWHKYKVDFLARRY